MPSLVQSLIVRLGIQPQVLEDRDGEQSKPPIIKDKAVNDLLCHLDTYKSMGPDGFQPGVLRELVEELAKPLSVICQQLWLTRKVPDDCRFTNMTPIYKKGQKEDRGNYRPVSLTLVPGKVVERFVLSHQACVGQPGKQAQPAWVHERQVLHDQPDLLL